VHVLALGGAKSLTTIPGFLQDANWMINVGMFIAAYLADWKLCRQDPNRNVR